MVEITSDGVKDFIIIGFGVYALYLRKLNIEAKQKPKIIIIKVKAPKHRKRKGKEQKR